MKLFRVTKNKLTKDKNGENVVNLEIIEVVLVYYNILNNDYKHDSRVLCIDLFQINHLVNYQISHLKLLYL